MAEARDPAIKLFGREIPVTEGRSPAAAAAAVEVAVDSGSTPEVESAGDEKDTCEEIKSTELKDSTSISVELDQGEPNSQPCLNNDNENTNQASTHHDKAAVPVKPEHGQADSDTSGQEKVLKKPDKILPCPRCKSLDTKFCYYNNYNVNQPRHFCKNCQRYWTAGGTMRNVPVGAGRRKNKHAASHCRQIVMSSDGLTSALLDAPDSSHQALPCVPSAALPSKGNVTVLKFGPEAPVSESIASVLNLQEQNRNNEPSPMVCQDNSEEHSCASSLTAAKCAVPENLVQMGQNGFPGYCNGVTPMHHLQCYPGHPWPYPWIPGWNSAMPPSQCSEVAHGQENSIPTPMTWSGPPIMGAPAFCAPAIPFPFIPAPWGCMPVWTGGKWSLPYVGTNCVLSPSSSVGNSGGSGNVVPNLGKHSRDASSLAEEKKKYLWAPKTLRIDDPEEASKSSIWATLGIKPDISGIFKGLQSKTQAKVRASDATQALHANPAALSRSRSFQESTDVRCIHLSLEN